MPKEDKKKIWGGRFANSTSSIMERIGESISFDQNLYKQDIRASKAHSKNLHKIGILNQKELESIHIALEEIEKEIEEGKFIFKIELEDIHMHIETRLTEKLGDLGKKIHTARSRNDQVAQDVRLYILDETKECILLLYELLKIVLEKAKNSTSIIMPGYTHLQVAQPIRASHYLLSYFWSFLRDIHLFFQSYELSNSLVLGSGALSGVNYPTDRELIQKELNLKFRSENSIDAVSSRDHIFHFIFSCTQTLVHFSRICEEIIIYSSVEFGLIHLPDELTTGSSIMPQKKNPDIAELIRGKSAKLISNLNHQFVLVKGLPLAYNRDLQEDKITLFDSVKQVKIAIEGIMEMIKGLRLNSDAMERTLHKGFATATDLADYLVSTHSVPFRDSHELVGKLVAYAVSSHKTLPDLTEEERVKISPYFGGEIFFDAISLENSTEKKTVEGGTSLQSQKEQFVKAENSLAQIRARLHSELNIQEDFS
jgi:argininosuccinate lyase